jgi:hypothetical protein
MGAEEYSFSMSVGISYAQTRHSHPNAAHMHSLISNVPISLFTYLTGPLMSHLHLMYEPMIRTPHASHRLVQTLNRLPLPPQLLATSRLKQLRLLQNFGRLHIPHANGLLAAIDVRTLDDWVLAGSRGDGDFDLRVCAGEGGEAVLQEGAVKIY